MLLLKEWFDLTDDDALGALAYDLRRHGALGISTARQRRDSPPVVSNFARLRRRGLFCATPRALRPVLTQLPIYVII